jgi:hypothetical protein
MSDFAFDYNISILQKQFRRPGTQKQFQGGLRPGRVTRAAFHDDSFGRGF